MGRVAELIEKVKGKTFIPDGFLAKKWESEKGGLRITNGPTPGTKKYSPFDNFPEELKILPQWVCWKKKPKPNGYGFHKLPLNAKTGEAAKVNEPTTWVDYHAAVEAYQNGLGDGISFALTEEDPYCGIELDHCREPRTGHIEPWAAEIVERCDSYTEATPSEDGVRIWMKGQLLGTGGNNGNGFEIYDRGRFFAVTGEHIGGTPTTIEPRQDVINELYAKYFLAKLRKKPGESGKAPHFSDTERAVILAELKAALPYIPAFDHDPWLHVGMGIHRVDASNDGFDLWVSWSKSCPEKFDLDDCVKRWRSFHNDGGITPKTIFALAIENGWRNTGEQRSYPNGAATGENRELPEIKITTDMTEVVNATERAMLDLPGDPQVFQHSRKLCFIGHGAPSPQWLLRDPDAPVIILAAPTPLRELANRAAKFLKYDKREKKWNPTLPPEWAIDTLYTRLSWKFPLLEAIITAPTIRADGKIIARPGYNTETGLFLDTHGIEFPAVKEQANIDDARAALRRLEEPFADFPFASAHHRSAAIAGALTVTSRACVQGCVPLFPSRSHTPGSGKGLLVDVIATIGTGRYALRWPQVEDPEEERKRLLTIAIAGDQCVHIDNVTKPLGSAPLDSAITSREVSDRLLGKNQSSTVPLRSVFFASGNNMGFTGDMARRVVPIDLDPKREKPEERSDFRHAPLLPWVKENRPRLVVDALTILKAYFNVGCPKQGVSQFGSFEEWSDLIRQALIWAGWPDPCEGRKNIEAESDSSYETHAVLLQCWQDCYGNEAATLAHAIQDASTRAVDNPSVITPGNEWNALGEALSKLGIFA